MPDLTRDCIVCDGKGYYRTTCGKCGGGGEVPRFFGKGNKPCPKCGGSGHVYTDCTTCKGTGKKTHGT